ncbi:carbohydrate kinase family protein [Thermospira aquatica]|uniref:Carbohydrate kinase n=1 Tax=Thermospira aquatica TaxID=2828656 RepID=A0AAX3BE94_9SPIR|nr:carbohydrate kinase [Thermospira aquatica]URA10433.1 carbohydrate kinase [Thermospira aquatica]
MYDIVSMGEILMDMTPVQGREGFLYEPNPGGAPANVAVACARLEVRSAFIGTVGQDFFGDLLIHTLEANTVDSSCIYRTSQAPTTLAFVHLDKKGERSFSFYRKPGADLFLPWGRKEKQTIENTRIFHFGSLSLTNQPARTVTKKALRYAKKKKKLISFDPNLRPSLWKDLKEAKRQIFSCLKWVDILKLSEEELLFLSAKETFEEALAWAKSLVRPIVLITRGENGVICLFQETIISTGSYHVEVVDTTGAGDAFVGGLLSQLSQEERPFHISRERLLQILKWASAVAAITVSRRGAIPALPSKEEVEKFLARYQEHMPS